MNSRKNYNRKSKIKTEQNLVKKKAAKKCDKKCDKKCAKSCLKNQESKENQQTEPVKTQALWNKLRSFFGRRS